MEKEKSAKFLFEMNHNEAQEIIEKRKSDKDFLISQIQFGRFAKHCLKCDECRVKAKEVGFLVSGKS